MNDTPSHPLGNRTPSFIRAVKNGVALDVHVQPNATHTGIQGCHGDRLKIRIAAPPNDHKANRELCRFLAQVLDIGRARVQIARGDHARTKTVLLTDVEFRTAAERLTTCMDAKR